MRSPLSWLYPGGLVFKPFLVYPFNSAHLKIYGQKLLVWRMSSESPSSSVKASGFPFPIKASSLLTEYHILSLKRLALLALICTEPHWWCQLRCICSRSCQHHRKPAVKDEWHLQAIVVHFSILLALPWPLFCSVILSTLYIALWLHWICAPSYPLLFSWKYI